MKTKIILEFGCNHNGNPDVARRMIEEAADLGVWGVKFQKRDLASIPPEMAAAPRDPATSFGRTYMEHRQALEFSADTLGELCLYAQKLGLHPGVTVFDEPSFHAVQGLPLSFLKTPSQLYTDRKLAALLCVWPGISMASTGMHDLEELLSQDHFGAHDVTFYCRSMYPFPVEGINLAKMHDLGRSLACCGTSELGYSSHEADGEGIPLAVIAGATYVERHYTLSRTMKGHDHKTVSSTYHDMKRILEDVRRAETFLGDAAAPLAPAELKVRKQFRGF